MQHDTNDTGAECDQADKTQSHIQPAFVLDPLNLAR